MFAQEIKDSVDYLSSAETRESLAKDPYWPKWHSPWWHMLALHEMGESAKIPESAVNNLIASLNSLPLKIFPIHPGELPQDLDPWRHTSCHCAVGCVYQILAARGVNVDERVPWLRPWLLRYQMPDGGMNCDSEAYLVKDECPSSMVGTVPPFEAILLHTARAWTPAEEVFLDRCARFLIERKLTLGSFSKQNAAERENSKIWTRLCFPRFYFYDALRGLAVLLEWSEKRAKPLPWNVIREVVEQLSPRNERLAYEGTTSIARSPSGEWLRTPAATLFPLLSATSALGASPYLERQWGEAQARIQRLRERGLIV